MDHLNPPETSPSNSVRLSMAEWIVVAAITVIAVVVLPEAWKAVEPLERGDDFRIPYELSEDYWLVSRYADRAARDADVLVVGDSVVWGAYVSRERTLSRFLEMRMPGMRFANLGIDGGHPAALAGLVRYHARGIAKSTVLLHFNPIWVSSPRHDLSEKKEFRFNHPELAPQFVPRIPCYRASVSDRLGVVVRRSLPFSCWIRHTHIVSFGPRSLPQWTIDNPYRNPARLIAGGAAVSGDQPLHEPIPWTRRGLGPQNFPWVDPEASIQWAFFREIIHTLQRRHNAVVVVLGPFNEHMLYPTSRDRYREIRSEVESWLRANGVECVAPDPLPSELYADASHPLAEGYDLLAAAIVGSGILD